MKTLKRLYGGMLLEMLLMIVVLGSILPFIYRQNIAKNENIENAAVASDLVRIKLAVENYISLIDPHQMTDGQVRDVDIPTLYDYGLPSSISRVNKYDQPYYIKIKKVTNPKGDSYIYGFAYVLRKAKSTVLKSFDVLKFTGPSGGVLEDGFIVGAGGAWMENPVSWGIPESLHGAVFIRISPAVENQIYIVRNGNVSERTMMTDLVLLYKDIKDANLINGSVLNTPILKFKGPVSEKEYNIDSLLLEGISSDDINIRAYIENMTATNLVVNGNIYLNGAGNFGGNTIEAKILENVGSINISSLMDNEGLWIYADKLDCIERYNRSYNNGLKSYITSASAYFYNKNVKIEELNTYLFSYTFDPDNSPYSMESIDNTNGNMVTMSNTKLRDITLSKINTCFSTDTNIRSHCDMPNDEQFNNLKRMLMCCQSSMNYGECYEAKAGNENSIKNVTLGEILTCLEIQKEYNSKLCQEIKTKKDPMYNCN